MAFYEDIVKDQNNKTKCELCNIFLNSDSSIELHLNDMNHNRLSMERMMIQNSLSITGNGVKCSICDKILGISEVFDHMECDHHKDIMNSIKQTILNNGGFVILPETKTNQSSMVDCLICDRTMKFNLNEINFHIMSDRHRRARSIAVQPLNAIFSVEDTTEDLWCKICQVYFENYIETIFEHVDEDPKHNKELAKLFLLIKDQDISIEKFLIEPKEDKAFCNKCSIEVPCNIDNLGSHVRGKRHKSYLS